MSYYTEDSNLNMTFSLSLNNRALESLENLSGIMPPLRDINKKKFVLFNFSYNKLSSLPDTICSFFCLEELDCSHNQLLSLPSSIGSLSSLEVLSCEYNQLENLPDSIYYLNKLKYLFCHVNPLTNLPPSIRRNSVEYNIANDFKYFLPPSIRNSFEYKNNIANDFRFYLEIKKTLNEQLILDLDSVSIIIGYY